MIVRTRGYDQTPGSAGTHAAESTTPEYFHNARHLSSSLSASPAAPPLPLPPPPAPTYSGNGPKLRGAGVSEVRGHRRRGFNPPLL